MISVGIIVINELELSRKCIESVQHHTLDPVDIVVCDNGSTDKATIDYLDSLAMAHEITLLRNTENQGVGPAWNACLTHANPASEFVSVLHNDAQVIPGWDDLMTAPFSLDPKIGITAVERCGNSPENRFIPGIIERDRQIAAGPIYVFKRSILDKVGLMDEQFVPIYFDDADWQARFKLGGYHISVVLEKFPHVEFTTTTKTRNPTLVSQIVGRNFDRVTRKFECTYVSALPGWAALTTPNDQLTWVYAKDNLFYRVDRQTDTIIDAARCVAPYRVPDSVCQNCIRTCWKKQLPKEERDFVAQHGLPLTLDYPVPVSELKR